MQWSEKPGGGLLRREEALQNGGEDEDGQRGAFAAAGGVRKVCR